MSTTFSVRPDTIVRSAAARLAGSPGLTIVDASRPDTVSVLGPVEMIDGNLILRIPLLVGGNVLAPLAGSIGQIEGDYLCVIIQPWLAEKLRIGAGSLVHVDNENGLFTITRSALNDGDVPDSEK